MSLRGRMRTMCAFRQVDFPPRRERSGKIEGGIAEELSLLLRRELWYFGFHLGV